MHVAVRYKNDDIVRWLCENHKQLINAKKGYSKWTPLHEAGNYASVHAVKILLEYGADPLAKAFDGKTPAEITYCIPAKEIIEKW